jgi:hypothetical protein
MNVTISPKSAKFEQNTSIQFDAAVAGDKAKKGVTWKCSGNGAIDDHGKFTADASALAGPVTITATTKTKPYKSDTVTLL